MLKNNILNVFFVFFCTLTVVLSINCWVCNSAIDKACNDPFNNATLAITDCNFVSHPTLTNSTFCRKTTQKFHNEVRIIRSCGFLEYPPLKEPKNCVVKDKDNIWSEVCSCDSNGCNEF